MKVNIKRDDDGGWWLKVHGEWNLYETASQVTDAIYNEMTEQTSRDSERRTTVDLFSVDDPSILFAYRLFKR